LTGLLAVLALGLTGCSSLRVRVTGDRDVRYQSAWTTTARGTETRSGRVPSTFSFQDEVTGWVQNSTGSGRMRVRVYGGMGVLLDETLVDSARRVVIERKGRGVSYRIE
jgi:hypothetical protein